MEKELTKNEKPKKEKKDIKKTLKSVLALVLVAVISIAGTLAFLQKKADQKKNVFLGSSGIDLTIQEPGFDANKDKAESYSPGSTITKDPYLVNTTTDDTSYEWVAMKVSYKLLVPDENLTDNEYNALEDSEKATKYKHTDGNYYTASALAYAKIRNVIQEIGFNGDNDKATGTNKKDWILIAGGEASDNYAIYMYKKRLAPKGTATVDSTMKTTNLFEKIDIRNPMYPINNVFDEDDEPSEIAIDNSSPESFPKFRIDIDGAAVKDEGYTYTTDEQDNNVPPNTITVTHDVEEINNLKEADYTAIKGELITLLSS